MASVDEVSFIIYFFKTTYCNEWLFSIHIWDGIQKQELQSFFEEIVWCLVKELTNQIDFESSEEELPTEICPFSNKKFQNNVYLLHYNFPRK